MQQGAPPAPPQQTLQVQQPTAPAQGQLPIHAAGQYAPAQFQAYSPATPAAAGIQPPFGQLTPLQIEQAPYVPRIDPTTGRPYQSVWRDRHDEEKKKSAALEAQVAAEQKARNDLYQELLAARAETAEAKRATEFEKKLSAVKGASQADAQMVRTGALFGNAPGGGAVHFSDDGIAVGDSSPEAGRKKSKKSKSKKKKKRKGKKYSSSDSSSSESETSSQGDTTSEETKKRRRSKQHKARARGAAAVKKFTSASAMAASGATSPPPSQKTKEVAIKKWTSQSAGPSAGTAGNAAPTETAKSKVTIAQVGKKFKTKEAKMKLKMVLVQFQLVKPEEAMQLTDEKAVEMAAKAHRDGVLDVRSF